MARGRGHSLRRQKHIPGRSQRVALLGAFKIDCRWNSTRARLTGSATEAARCVTAAQRRIRRVSKGGGQGATWGRTLGGRAEYYGRAEDRNAEGRQVSGVQVCLLGWLLAVHQPISPSPKHQASMDPDTTLPPTLTLVYTLVLFYGPTQPPGLSFSPFSSRP